MQAGGADWKAGTSWYDYVLTIYKIIVIKMCQREKSAWNTERIVWFEIKVCAASEKKLF